MFFVAEHFYHFLATDDLFYITVQFPQRCLLCLIITAAALCNALPGLQHYGQHDYRNNGQIHIGIEHQGKCTHNTDQTGNDLHHRLIQHFSHRIHIVCKTAHNIAMVIAVKIPHRQLLYLAKQIPTQTSECVLGYHNHNSGLQILRQDARGKNCRHTRH